MENLYKTYFCDTKGYLPFSNFLKNCNIDNFKSCDNLTYMTEHIGEAQKQYGLYFYNEIKKFDLIDNEFVNKLINLNDSLGNPVKYFIHEDIKICSPNTLKYIYFGLLNIIYIKNNNIQNFDFIEIGGGYGGQCVILLELFKHFNIIINKYILIDLPDVVKFQLNYINKYSAIIVKACHF